MLICERDAFFPTYADTANADIFEGRVDDDASIISPSRFCFGSLGASVWWRGRGCFGGRISYSSRVRVRVGGNMTVRGGGRVHVQARVSVLRSR